MKFPITRFEILGLFHNPSVRIFRNLKSGFQIRAHGGSRWSALQKTRPERPQGHGPRRNLVRACCGWLSKMQALRFVDQSRFKQKKPKAREREFHQTLQTSSLRNLL